MWFDAGNGLRCREVEHAQAAATGRDSQTEIDLTLERAEYSNTGRSTPMQVARCVTGGAHLNFCQGPRAEGSARSRAHVPAEAATRRRKGESARGDGIECGGSGDPCDVDRMRTNGSSDATPPAPDRVEHSFRQEYGRVVAVLTRRVGVRHLEQVEDAVQAALVAALTAWTTSGQPDDPGAWVYRVAHNHLIGALRARDTRERTLHRRTPANAAVVEELSEPQFDTELADDMLRMLFVCCDESIPRESRLALALKTLCGFDTTEIALRILIS
jgi:RNA polymerase sigma factor (sigma-70 family)